MNSLKTIKLFGLIALLAFGPLFVRQTLAQPGADVPVESFYDELAPYGQWAQHPNYGNVWQPNTGPDFQPYSTGGHWVMTEYGNTWVSDYAWGWAPFHYGRWIYDPAYDGWLWIPGTDWGPAWVSWRSGGGYYGWAPLGPGVNINVNIPAPYWTFIPQVYFTSPSWYSYCVPRPRVVNIYQNTTIINNYYRSNNRAYNYGPPRGDIERVTRQSVPVYRVDRMDRPGRSVIGNGSVGFYRPGQSSGNGQTYGRNDQFDNPSRPTYNGTNPSTGDYYGRGNRMPNRSYTGTTMPGRDNNGSGTLNGNYGSNGNGSGRGNYGGNAPVDRSGNYNLPDAPQPNRFEQGRGNYSPDKAQRANTYPENMAHPGRLNERFERQGQLNTPSVQEGRSGNGFQRMPENGSMQNQQRNQEQPQQSTSGVNPGGRGQRGPR